jgi:hypothetical protein
MDNLEVFHRRYSAVQPVGVVLKRYILHLYSARNPMRLLLLAEPLLSPLAAMASPMLLPLAELPLHYPMMMMMMPPLAEKHHLDWQGSLHSSDKMLAPG